MLLRFLTAVADDWARLLTTLANEIVFGYIHCIRNVQGHHT